MKTRTLLLQLAIVIIFLVVFNLIIKRKSEVISSEDEQTQLKVPPTSSSGPQQYKFNSSDFPIQILKPVGPVTYNMQENRYNLQKIVQWMDYSVYMNSVDHYGLLVDEVAFLDVPYGDEPTHADVISYISGRYFPGPKTYLEVGVGVGKTFYQMCNAFSNSLLFGYEIENITPVLESVLSSKEVMSHWPTIHTSARKADSTWTSYKFPDSHSEVHYLAADIYDTDSWRSLQTHKFDVILLNGPPESISAETELLLSMNIVSYARFLIWYGGLDGENATNIFFENVNKLKEKRFRWLQNENVAVVQARGTFDDARNYGIISTLNISHILREDLTNSYDANKIE